MSWPLFAVIQLSIVTVGVMVAFWLRNRELKQRYADLETASSEAFAAVEQAKEQLLLGADKAWIGDRLEALTGDDEVSVIQRLVLANEFDADPEFPARLCKHLNSGESAKQAFSEQWREIRTASHELATHLVENYPLSHPVIAQLYDAFAELDTALSVELPQLPDAPDTGNLDATDASQAAENLRASNELMQQELDRLKEEISNRDASTGDAKDQADDLKGLLQQFTKDSRDMMECIRNLELENKYLREQLGLDADANANTSPEPPPAKQQPQGEEDAA